MVAAHMAKKTAAIHCRKLRPSSVFVVSIPLSFTAPVSTAARKNSRAGSGMSRWRERRRMASAATTEPMMMR